MIVDLVQLTTRDGFRLDGTFQTASIAPTVPVDAFCLIHGTGGNFYSSTLLADIASSLTAMGCAVLHINTRGHDNMSTASTGRGGRRQGAAYEVVDDCRHDIAAAIEFLQQRAGQRIGLIGHSLGAVKCLYALAQEPQLSAACVAALSPPRLSYSWFCASPEGREFLETFALAERTVLEGQPAALLDVKLPLPLVITSAGYVEKYGPDERYNYLRFLASMPCPTLVTLGSLEVENNMAFRGSMDEVAAIARRRPQIHADLISGADHFYRGKTPELLAQLKAWLTAL